MAEKIRPSWNNFKFWHLWTRTRGVWQKICRRASNSSGLVQKIQQKIKTKVWTYNLYGISTNLLYFIKFTELYYHSFLLPLNHQIFDDQFELIKSEYDESRNYFYGDFDRKAEGNCIRNPGKSEHECCGGHRKGSKILKNEKSRNRLEFHFFSSIEISRKGFSWLSSKEEQFLC